MFAYIAAILLSFLVSHIIFECCSIKSLFYQIVTITCVYIVVLYAIANVKESFQNSEDGEDDEEYVTDDNNYRVSDCANNGTCIQKPDDINLFPTNEHVALPKIGEAELMSMENLNPVFETVHPMAINSHTSMEVNGSIENFSLFEDYNMSDKNKPIYVNAPEDKRMCSSCVVGECVGDLCSVKPYAPFQRHDPMDM